MVEDNPVNSRFAERYLEINGTWEDHIRYGITTEEWVARRDELVSAWIDQPRDLV